MKKTILTIAIALLSISSYSQKELEFIGDAAILKSDSTYQLLEKHLTQTRTVASAGLIMTGIGKVKTQLQIKGCCSSVTAVAYTKMNIVIKSVDNNHDPLSVIKIFKLNSTTNYRRAEIGSFSALGGHKDNTLDYLPFNGKKFGTSSYLVQLEDLVPGEYGITILNPNMPTEKQVVVSTFQVTLN